jgi:hypothetical protein
MCVVRYPKSIGGAVGLALDLDLILSQDQKSF